MFAANASEPSEGLLLSAANETAPNNLFEVLQPDGFRIPFGDFPIDAIDARTGRKIPVMQRVDAAAANEMIAALSTGFLGRKGRAPIYIGHPDVPGNEQRWPDKTAYGWIKSGSVEANAVVFAANYGRRGSDLVQDAAFMYYSPNFGLKRTGETTADGIPVCRPAALLSMGLVNDSNIPVPPLVAVNEDPTQTPEPAPAGGPTPKGNHMNPEQLKQLLAALGLADGTEFPGVLDKCKSLVADITRLTTELDGANAKLKTGCATAANELLKPVVKTFLDRAIEDKRITAAQRPHWETLFGADFSAANESLSAIPAPAPTAPQSDACRGRASGAMPKAAEAAARFHGHVNENKTQLRQTMVGANEHAIHQAAWSKAQAEHKDDFDLMSKPE